MKPEAD